MLATIQSRHEWTLEEYLQLPEQLRQQQHCVNCGQCYMEIANRGLWLCRLHPGIQLKDARTGRAFYSCCGWNGDCHDRTQSSRLAQGCLQSDHMSMPLNYDSQALRLQQLLLGGVVTVPVALLRYMRYEQNAILYDSRQSPMRGTTRLVLSPLQQTRQNYERYRLEGATPVSCNSNMWSTKCSTTQQQDSLLVDPYAIATKLYDECLQSPLLLKSLQQDEAEASGCNGTKNRVTARCEAIWRIPDRSASRNTGIAPQQQPQQRHTLPFVMIGRFAQQYGLFSVSASPLPFETPQCIFK